MVVASATTLQMNDNPLDTELRDVPQAPWPLSAPESWLLLNGPNSASIRPFELAVVELLARGALALTDAVEARRLWGDRTIKILVDGPSSGGLTAPLGAVFQLYGTSRRRTFQDGKSGVKLRDLGSEVASFYKGRLYNYGLYDVMPRLMDRGWFGLAPRRFLFFPLQPRYEITLAGTSAQMDLKRWLQALEFKFGAFIDRDPEAALSLAARSGAALLLSPIAVSQLYALRGRFPDRQGAVGDATPIVWADTDQQFDLGAIDSLVDSFGGFDFSFDVGGLDFGGDFGGGDGGGGDGGGGD